MAALADNFHGWRPVPGTGGITLAMPVIPSVASDEFYRGAIVTQAATPAGLKVTNAVTTDRPCGINQTRYTSVNAATIQLIDIWMKGVVWFTGVAAIATASVTYNIYPLASSDNPADLTATAAGNCSAFGTILAIEVTAVSGYIDLDRTAIMAETA